MEKRAYLGSLKYVSFTALCRRAKKFAALEVKKMYFLHVLFFLSPQSDKFQYHIISVIKRFWLSGR